MNKLLKKVLAVVLTASMALSALPVLASSASFVQDSAVISSVENTDISAKAALKRNGKRIFTVCKSGEDFTAEVTVSGAAAADASVYAVSADGKETLLGKTENPADADISVTADMTKLPADAVNVSVRLSAEGNVWEVCSVPVTEAELSVPEEEVSGFSKEFEGAHDPSIVKFPDDPKYYVYSSHHLIFTSEDLINWTKYDFTKEYRTSLKEEYPNGTLIYPNAKIISQKTYDFIYNNIDTKVNGTYWAPDVIYVEGDSKPYWMYISVSCGLGARNSVISLMKSSSPLFWADDNAQIEDVGVVFATMETSDYKTNAIDANIYTDKNGNRYFIWGSFWGGIQGAKLTAEGFVDGVDYSSDAKLLESCRNFGKTLFAQKVGIAGPEGAWVIEHGDYRYMFTSYGWLGSNYNTRVARSPLTDDFQTVLSTASGSSDTFVDANGVKLGLEYTNGDKAKQPTGYKLIGSYRLGEGASNILRTDYEGNYFISRIDSDPYIYYGPGHNSVIKVSEDEYYYVSHIRKDINNVAYLQVRKLLWINDWPVVSPVSYTGEKEQVLPAELIEGTYDLASPGYTKMRGAEVTHKGADLPVISSKLTLAADKAAVNDLGETVGSWEYDNDHTVTITFTADGDMGKDEFYKSGDTMTLKAILSYDRDAKKYVMALTGADSANIAQFATKPMDAEAEPTLITADTTVIEKSAGGNPELGFDADGNIMYGGDPAAFVEGDTVYLYVGHDTSANEGYCMPEWACYSSKNMTDWTYEGVVLRATDISWRNDDASAWASQAVKYGDKYYLYFCTWDSTSGIRQSIGVAVSDSPKGPFKDIGKPLVKGTDTEPESSGWNDIDPTVWIETDENGTEHRYLAWGNGKLYMCELNEDMVSVKSGTLKEHGIAFSGTNAFTEAPWLYRRQDADGNYYGQYYLFYAQNFREEMAYAVTDDIDSGRWIYKGRLMPPTATSNTNHPSVIDFKGKTYFIYHNGALPHGSGFRRSVCIEELVFNEDGTIDPIKETSTGLTGTAVTICAHTGQYLSYDRFENPLWDSAYPIIRSVKASNGADDFEFEWEITKGLYEPDNKSYVSIQAVNKPGLYIKEDGISTVLTQDADGYQAKSMTFKTVSALDGSDGVSFESVSRPGRFLTASYGNVTLTYGDKPERCVFKISTDMDTKSKAIHISDQTVFDDKITFVINNGEKTGAAVAYIAEYENNILSGVKIEDVTVTESNQFVEIPYARQSDENMVKVFLWQDMKPAVTAAVIPAQTPPPAEMPPVPDGCTSYYGFEDNLSDYMINSSGVLTGPFAVWGTNKTAVYEDGYKGKALSFTGADSYGVKLGRVLSQNTYTVSFRFNANVFMRGTPILFMDSDNVSAADAGKKTDSWVSMPMGWDVSTVTADAWKLKVWSQNNGTFVDFISGFTAEKGKWYQVTITSDGTTSKMYIDGEPVGSGTIAPIIAPYTTVYLGVNHWDTPFNGLLDDLYIYDGTALTAEQVKELYTVTK